MMRSANISPDYVYRYSLRRWWNSEDNLYAVFVLLNPSTADAEIDDPTVRRCINFAKRWNMGGLFIVNLFALRATNPRALLSIQDPIGPDNDTNILGACLGAQQIIVGWGTQDGDLGHLIDRRVAEVRLKLLGHRLYALGMTRSGAPRHPLYVPAHAHPSPWPNLVPPEAAAG